MSVFLKPFAGWIVAAAFALGLALGSVSAGRIVWLHKQHQIDNLMVAQAKREVAIATVARQQQAAQDQLALTNAVAEAQAQEKIVRVTTTIIKEVPRYVTPAQDASTCVTYGLVRVFDAAAKGLDPSDLDLPAGQSDDACAPVKASDLARGIAENFGIARQNAQQLDALIADVRERVEISNSVPHP